MRVRRLYGGNSAVTWLSRSGALVGLTALVAAYAVLLFSNTSFAVGGSDSSGYFNAARMFLQGRVSEPVSGFDALELTQDQIRVVLPLGYVPAARPGHMASFYPIGFSLHVAAASVFPGLVRLPFLVSPVAALVAVLLTFALAREVGVSRVGSLCAAASLAICPVMVFQGIQPMSDSVATAWSIAAVLLALKSSRKLSFSLLSGAAFGIALMVRPTNLLLILPILAALPLHRRKVIALFLGGTAPFLLVIFIYNTLVFGSPWISGYSIAGATQEFSGSYFFPRFWHYLRWTSSQFTPFVLIFWTSLMALSSVRRQLRLVLGLWFTAFFLFYGFYKPYDAWWYTRFLLPAYPALVVGAFLFLESIGIRAARWRAAIQMTLAAVIVVAASLMIHRFDVLEFDEGQASIPVAAQWLVEHVPSDAVVLSMEMSGTLTYSSNLTVLRWDWVDETFLRELADRTWRDGRPVVALLMPHEVEAVDERFPGWFVKQQVAPPFTFAVLDHRPQGFLDGINGTQVFGWAFDRDLARPGAEGASNVRLVLNRDGIELKGAWQSANLPREDLVASGAVEQETHAFILDLNTLTPGPGQYEVIVEAENYPSGIPVPLAGRQVVTIPPAAEILSPQIAD